MAIRSGDQALSFELSHKPGQAINLGNFLNRKTIILLFFPLAFSSVCTEEMCYLRDHWSEWSELDADVFGICVDSPFVTDRFRADENIPFPILSDFNKDVSRSWGVLYDNIMGLKGVTKRAAFVIDKNGMVVYDWVAEEPGEQVIFDEIKAAAEQLKSTVQIK